MPAKVSAVPSVQEPVEDPQAYMYKPPPPYPGTKADTSVQQAISSSSVKNAQTGEASSVFVAVASAMGTLELSPVSSVPSTEETVQPKLLVSSVENIRTAAIAQPQVSPSSSFTANSSARSSKTSIGNKSVEQSASGSKSASSSSSLLDVSKSPAEKVVKRSSTPQKSSSSKHSTPGSSDRNKVGSKATRAS